MSVADRLRERFWNSPAARLDDQPPDDRLDVEELRNGLPEEGAAGLALALILLRHGHLDEAHRLAQRIAGQDGDFVHALMHRMEGDLGNACYWHTRHGRHPVHDRLSDQMADGELDEPVGIDRQRYDADTLTRRLTTDGQSDQLLALHRAEINALFEYLQDRMV